MTLKGFNIELIPLSEEYLEEVRQWRNSENTAKYMEYKGEISKDEQLQWFHSLTDAHYFVIRSKFTNIGLINLKCVDNQLGTAESGLFIGNPQFLGTGGALGASILLLDFAFNELNLNEITAKVNKQNTDAKMYNELLGFICVSSINDAFCHWKLDKISYQENRAKLVQFIS